MGSATFPIYLKKKRKKEEEYGELLISIPNSTILFFHVASSALFLLPSFLFSLFASCLPSFSSVSRKSLLVPLRPALFLLLFSQEVVTRAPLRVPPVIDPVPQPGARQTRIRCCRFSRDNGLPSAARRSFRAERITSLSLCPFQRELRFLDRPVLFNCCPLLVRRTPCSSLLFENPDNSTEIFSL